MVGDYLEIYSILGVFSEVTEFMAGLRNRKVCARLIADPCRYAHMEV